MRPVNGIAGLPGTLSFTYPALLALDAVGSKSVAKSAGNRLRKGWVCRALHFGRRLRAIASRMPLRKLNDSEAQKRLAIASAALITIGNGVDLNPISSSICS